MLPLAHAIRSDRRSARLAAVAAFLPSLIALAVLAVARTDSPGLIGSCAALVIASSTLAGLTLARRHGRRLRDQALITAGVTVVYGHDLLSVWPPSDEPPAAVERVVAAGAELVSWAARSETKSDSHGDPEVTERPAARLFVKRWENPRPAVAITSLDLRTDADFFTTPFVLAITAEEAW